MKNVKVQLAAAECQPVKISLMPSVTAGEIVRELELPGFCLFLPAVPPKFFTEKEEPMPT